MNKNYGVININFLKPFCSDPDSITPNPGLSISGNVRTYNNLPISSAILTFNDYTSISNLEGFYSINNIPIGSSGELTCEYPGCLFAPKTIQAMTDNVIMNFEEV